MLFQPKNLSEKESIDAKKDKVLKLYSEPQLQELGDLRSLTLGGSRGGSFDSGGPTPWTYP